MLADGIVDCHFEADQFFTDKETGVYKFQHSKLTEAHRWCLIETLKAVSSGKRVVVSNVLPLKIGVEVYERLAASVGATCEVITLKGTFGSVMGIPPEEMEKIVESFEYEED